MAAMGKGGPLITAFKALSGVKSRSLEEIEAQDSRLKKVRSCGKSTAEQPE
jgi:hypothetical protein